MTKKELIEEVKGFWCEETSCYFIELINQLEPTISEMKEDCDNESILNCCLGKCKYNNICPKMVIEWDIKAITKAIKGSN